MLALGLAGCVNKVTQTKPGQLPNYRDRIEARYQRPVNDVYQAAQRSILSFGNVVSESEVFVSTNQIRTLEGSINGKGIYVRIEAVDPVITSATVQVRTKMGGTDLQTARDVIRQIAVELN